MKLLFDTHALIWWHEAPEKLSERVMQLGTDTNNSLMISMVTLWEIQIKSQLGKLQLKRSLSKLIGIEQYQNRVDILPIEVRHVLALDQLPLHHHDPFDRLLIAQAMVEKATLLSRDRIMMKYPIDVAW